MMIEMLIGCVIALLTGAAIVSLTKSNYVSTSVIEGQNFSNTAVRRPLDVLGDTLRNAQAVTVGAGSQALSNASAADVTCYTSLGTTRLWLDTSVTPHVLQRTKTASDGTVTTTPLLSGVQSLQLTYYVPASSAYNAAVSGWNQTADPHAPSASEMSNVGAVDIQATVTVDDETRALESFVRLRNSPNIHDS